MPTLRIENRRGGVWMVRAEGEVSTGTPLAAIREQTRRLALNHPARAVLNGMVVVVVPKLSPREAAMLFGL